jgi:Family of unknown function (DUF5343)
MTQESTIVDKGAAAPYISFLTLTNLIDWLSEVGIPLQLDRSFWGQKFSGAVGAQLMTTLRFFDLLDGDKPQPALEELVAASPEDRKRRMAVLIREKYSPIFSIGELERVTPKQILDTLQVAYNVSGDTARKALSFFINACKYADIGLSNTLRKQARMKRSSTTRPRRVKVNGTSDQGQPPAGAAPPADTLRGPATPRFYDRTVEFAGGQIIAMVSFDPFSVSPKNRDFVFRLVDMLKEFEAQQQSAEATDGKYEEASGLHGSDATPDASEGSEA